MNFIEVAMAAPAAEPVVSMGVFYLIAHAGFVVQLVLLFLFLASVISWTIIFSKRKLLSRCGAGNDRFLDAFWSGRSMDHIYSESKKFSGSSLAKIFQSGYVELQRLMEKERQKSPEVTDPLKLVPGGTSMDNLERALNRAHRSETLRLEQSLTFLATVGSTAPFIGLFGTVWGIMNSFQSIGMQGAASLATVAPGISEALIATALGLAAAIPAVIAYNYFLQKVRTIRTSMDNFGGDFLNIVKRNFIAG